MSPQESSAAAQSDAYLRPGRFIDSDHAAVRAFARRHADPAMPAREIAVALYYAVRDGFRYDPYQFDMSEGGLKASRVVENGFGFCVPKAALLAAAARASGVPARLGFADVRNHLTSPRLRDMMKTDLFVFHGYAELLIDGAWRKATPAFNLALCEKAKVKPLEFDGGGDSIFHEFDALGRRHMEYVNDRGTYADVPREEMLAVFHEVYPNYHDWIREGAACDFAREVDTGPST